MIPTVSLAPHAAIAALALAAGTVAGWQGHRVLATPLIVEAAIERRMTALVEAAGIERDAARERGREAREAIEGLDDDQLQERVFGR